MSTFLRPVRIPDAVPHEASKSACMDRHQDGRLQGQQGDEGLGAEAQGRQRSPSPPDDVIATRLNSSNTLRAGGAISHPPRNFSSCFRQPRLCPERDSEAARGIAESQRGESTGDPGSTSWRWFGPVGGSRTHGVISVRDKRSDTCGPPSAAASHERASVATRGYHQVGGRTNGGVSTGVGARGMTSVSTHDKLAACLKMRENSAGASCLL